MRRRAFLLASSAALAAPVSFAQGKTPATLYKSPGCKCCDGYADHLREEGFDVTVIESPDMTSIHRRNGVPKNLEGCHATLVGGYVVEGHVPANAVRRLLSERPAIKGISLPGMPMGSPGMGGDKEKPFEILSITGEDGPAPVFSVE